MGLFKKSCWTNSTIETAPNPDPSRYEILDSCILKNSFVLKVKYMDCTNFEGIKILAYKGKFILPGNNRLDPHFSTNKFSPIARFKPTEEGWNLAIELANKL